MEPFVKSLWAEGSLRLSKQQLNFHQNKSLPQEGSGGTTKSIPVLHWKLKGWKSNEGRKSKHLFRGPKKWCAEHFQFRAKHHNYFWKEACNVSCSRWIFCVKMIKKKVRRRNPPIPPSSFLLQVLTSVNKGPLMSDSDTLLYTSPLPPKNITISCIWCNVF